MIEGKSIVLTGVTGRVGTAFAYALAARNEVHGVARFGRPGERERYEALGIRTHRCDLASGDFSGLPTAPDYVIHTAANVAPQSSEEGFRDNAEAAGLLAYHCRKASGFLHVSTTGVYIQNPAPDHVYREDVDPVGGGGALGHYAGSKVAGEGAVRAMARAFDLPLIICRLDVQYGLHHDGGMCGKRLAMLLAGEPIPMSRQPVYHRLVSDEDLVAFVEPCLLAASATSPTVHWCGDDVVRYDMWIDHMAALVGVVPDYRPSDDAPYRSCIPDNESRLSITGPCRIDWRSGLERFVDHWAPKMQSRFSLRRRSASPVGA